VTTRLTTMSTTVMVSRRRISLWKKASTVERERKGRWGLRRLQAPRRRSRRWDPAAPGPHASVGVPCPSAPDRGTSGVGNKRRRRRSNPQLSSGHATSPAEGAGRPRGGVVADTGSPSSGEGGAAHGS
jgi:hypothetical protein